MRTLLRPSITILFALGLLASVVMPGLAQEEDHFFANESFEDRWERTDRPVLEGVIDRTWMWGPGPRTDTLLEEYADSPDGIRQVQYFDKSRMEINDPAADPGDLWQVTNGLLVVEMVEGRIQTGDDDFVEDVDPADIPIAGDLGGGDAVTYATINELGLRLEGAREEGTLINETIENGEIVADSAYDDYGVTALHEVQEEGVNNTVASPFWGFMNATGLIYAEGQYVVEDLFLNAYYATGYPITEAYWSTVMLQGEPTDVLWQCFERRCLTYTPSNPDGWEVESGNVGMHYYNWRYGADGHDTRDIHVGLVAIGDAGQQGWEFGCEDSLVTVDTQIQEQVTVENEVRAALQTLFAYDHPELSNLFSDQPIFVESVGVSDGIAQIWLAGNPGIAGVCDEPRFVEQINATAMQFDEVNHVDIYLNGEEFELGQMDE